MATIKLQELNEAGNPTDLDDNTNLVFRLTDVRNLDTNTAPMTRPAGGVVRSFEKWIRIHASALNNADRLANFQLYMADGAAPAAGVTFQVGLADAYAAPVKTDSTVAVADLFSYTSANPLAVTVANLQYGPENQNAGADIPASGQIGKYIVIQMDVTSQADLGLFSTNYGEIPISVRWDVIA